VDAKGEGGNNVPAIAGAGGEGPGGPNASGTKGEGGLQEESIRK